MTDLMTTIARGEYEIDSAKVAEEMIAKMRIVNRVRTQLESPRRPARRARDFDRFESWIRDRGRAAL